MKNLILLFTLLFTASLNFVSCKNNQKEEKVESRLEENIVAEDVDVEIDDFDKYDLDDDGLWDSDEFGEAFEGRFDEWDADGDGLLDEEEFYTVTYLTFDTNNDNRISMEEWNQNYNSIDDYAGKDDWAVFDKDGDDFLNMEEWFNAFEDGGWFDNYDANTDGFIDDDELHDGFFDDWDFNNDQKIDKKEFEVSGMSF